MNENVLEKRTILRQELLLLKGKTCGRMLASKHYELRKKSNK
jgi:hypothetical protein